MRKTSSLRQRGMGRLIAAVVAALPAVGWAGTTYYVSPTGNDNADGLTPETAWSSLDKVSNTSFAPGSNILFQSGGTWRGEQLTATSSGTADAPITYGSYGTGAKPTFYGSDILDKGGFQPVAGTSSTYVIPQSKTVGSVLASGDFLHSSLLLTNNSADPAVNKAYVNAHPDSWYYDTTSKSLYVNTGSKVPADPRQLTAVVQDDVVWANAKNNIVFNNLAVDETAGYGLSGGSGYGFDIHATSNVTIQNCDAFHTGKHAFGTTDSTNFVGNNLTAAYMEPDQGVGGASPFVAYNEAQYAGGTYSFNNLHVSNVGDSSYPAWVSHGDTGHITLNNVTSIGSSINLSGNTTGTNLRITDAGATAGPGDIINGLWMSGKNAQMLVYSNANISNMVIDKYVFESGYPSPIVSYGTGSTISLSTVTLGQQWWSYVSLFSFNGAGSNLKVLGTIFDCDSQNVQMFNDPTQFGDLMSDYSLFTNSIFFTDAGGHRITFDQWKALTGGDINSLQGAAGFLDEADGNYHRFLNDEGVDAIPDSLLPSYVVYDFDGVPRPQGNGVDIGAFEALVPEPGFVGVALVGGLGLLGRRRR